MFEKSLNLLKIIRRNKEKYTKCILMSAYIGFQLVEQGGRVG